MPKTKSLPELEKEAKEAEEVIASRIWVITGHPMDDCKKEASAIAYALIEKGFLIRKEAERINAGN